MNQAVETTIKNLKDNKLISWLVLYSSVVEEILKRRRRTTLAIGATISLLVLVLLGFSGGSKEEGYINLSDDSCLVAGINLHGGIYTYIPYHGADDSYYDYDSVSSEDIISIIREANNTENIKAILIEVDSVGGSPVAGEEIANAIKNSTKPVVAVVRESGVSAAYWAISGADRIFASKNSDVGSIGVTSSYLSNVIKNGKDGYTYVQLSTGKFKDSGDPDKPLTAEERSLFLRDLNIIHQNFIEAVSENRGLPLEQIKAIADGSTVLGERAKELGLIDEIGSIPEAQQYLGEIIEDEPQICWQ
jgi:signal peptide peptidase SppA